MLKLLKRLKEMFGVFVQTARFGHEATWHEPEETFRKYSYYELVFDGESFAGFKIKYKLTIDTEPETPVLPHIEIPLISKSERDVIFKAVNEKFIHWMKETNRYFHFIHSSGRCHVIRLTENGEIKADPNCSDTVNEFQKSEFIEQGCRVRLNLIDAWVDLEDNDAMIRNYNMVDKEIRNSLREQIENKKVEETWVIMVLEKLLKAQRMWKQETERVDNRTHKGKLLKVETKSYGNEVMVGWNFDDPENRDLHLRGFRREETFASGNDDTSQGVFIIDHWGNDVIVERLEPGKTYFYTFKVSCLERTNETSDAKREVEQEIFRFKVSTSPNVYMASIEKKISLWIEKIKTPQAVLPAPLSPERKKINQLVEYLDSYVEFDDALTQREKVLIKEMDEKKYSPKERKDKIERLKLVVEELRQQNS